MLQCPYCLNKSGEYAITLDDLAGKPGEYVQVWICHKCYKPFEVPKPADYQPSITDLEKRFD